MQLDKQIQTHCLYPHSQTDSVEINAPEYDSNTDSQTDTLPDKQPQVPSHAENTEEDSAPVTAKSEEYSTLPQDSDRFESQSESVQNSAEYLLLPRFQFYPWCESANCKRIHMIQQENFLLHLPWRCKE